MTDRSKRRDLRLGLRSAFADKIRDGACAVGRIQTGGSDRGS